MTTRSAAHRWICTNCLLEIRHQPTFHVGLAFCCAGCVAGGPCRCSYDDDSLVLTPRGHEPEAVLRIEELAGVA